jgi:two-component system phosphate regulon response regulator PhoB
MEGSVLVVEHDGALRELMASNLRHAGYNVACAEHVTQAAGLARGSRPDVALLDWAPGEPGLTFARQMRGDQRTADMSIIMVSARSTEPDRIAALESGADDYVTKPFSMRELLARVKAVLRRRAPQLADDILESSGLRFDAAARRVTAGDRELDLRNTEFRLLHYFMTHAHRTFSRRQLLDAVWGEQSFVEERTVDVHVRRLRRALTQTGHEGLVETVRGVGFRFRPDAATRSTPTLSSAVFDLARIGRARRRIAIVAPSVAPSVGLA